MVAQDRNRVLIWQSDGPAWTKTNTSTDMMVGFDELQHVDADIIDYPANFGRFPTIVFAGKQQNANKDRLLPLIAADKP